MSRVHCIDCDMPVVLDPSGLCPDGHLVGPGGSRVESAIGSDVPYPDEPEPWVVRVELDDEPVAEPLTRIARPVVAPGMDPGAGDTDEDQADSDVFLRELHSLSELTGTSAASPLGSVAPRDPTRDTAPPSPADDDSFAELSALEAAVKALEENSSPPPAPRAAAPSAPAAPSGSVGSSNGAVDSLAELEGLFELQSAKPPAPAGFPRPATADSDTGAATPAPPVPEPPVTLPVAQEDHRSNTPDMASPDGDGDTASPPAPPADAHIDLGNFTARGKKVTNGSKRRWFGR